VCYLTTLSVGEIVHIASVNGQVWSAGGMILTRIKPKYSYKNLSQCHFVHHKFHMKWPGIEPGPPL
jgi:hypothetical protein